MENAKSQDIAPIKNDASVGKQEQQPLTDAEGLEKNMPRQKKKTVLKIRLYDDPKDVKKIAGTNENDGTRKDERGDDAKSKESARKEEKGQPCPDDTDKKKGKGKYTGWWRSDETAKLKHLAAEHKEIKAFATHVEPLFGLIEKYLSTTRKAQLAEQRLSETLKEYLAIGDPYVCTLSDRIDQLTPDTTELLEAISDCERTLKMVAYHCNKYIFMSEARKEQNFEELMMSKKIFIGMLAVYVLRVFATKRTSRGECAEDKILSAAQAYCECYNGIKSDKEEQSHKKKSKRQRRVCHTPESRSSNQSYHMSMQFEELQNALPGVDMKTQLSPAPRRHENQITSPPLVENGEQRIETSTPPLTPTVPPIQQEQPQNTDQQQQLLSPHFNRLPPSMYANLDGSETEKRPSHRRTNSTNSIKLTRTLPNIHWKDCKVNPDASAREILTILNQSIAAFERNNDIYLMSQEKQQTEEAAPASTPTKEPFMPQRYSVNTKARIERSESADDISKNSSNEPIVQESSHEKETSISKESKATTEKRATTKRDSAVSETVGKVTTPEKFENRKKRDSTASEILANDKSNQISIDSCSTGTSEPMEELSEGKDDVKKSFKELSKERKGDDGNEKLDGKLTLKRHKHRRGKSKTESVRLNEDTENEKSSNITLASLSEPKEDNVKPSQLYYLENFVKNPASFFFIQSFMMRSLSSENISFIQQVLQYRDMRTEEKRRFMLKKIYDTFLSHNAPYPINVSASAIEVVKNELTSTNSLLGKKESSLKRDSSDFSSSLSLRESASTPQLLTLSTDGPVQSQPKSGVECSSPSSKWKRSDFAVVSTLPFSTTSPIKSPQERMDGFDPLYPFSAAYREITMLLILNRTKELFEGSISAKMLKVFLTRNNAIAAEERVKREKEKLLGTGKKKESKKGDDPEKTLSGDLQSKKEAESIKTTDFLPDDKQEPKDNRKEYIEKRKQILKQFKLKKLKERLFDQKKSEQETRELSKSASLTFAANPPTDTANSKETISKAEGGKVEHAAQEGESDQTSTTSAELTHTVSDESGSTTKSELSSNKKRKERKGEKKKDRNEKEKKSSDTPKKRPQAIQSNVTDEQQNTEKEQKR